MTTTTTQITFTADQLICPVFPTNEMIHEEILSLADSLLYTWEEAIEISQEFFTVRDLHGYHTAYEVLEKYCLA